MKRIRSTLLGTAIVVAATLAASNLTFTPGAAAVGGGGYDASVYESVGPDVIGRGMAQSYSGDGRFTVFESDQLLTPEAVGDLRHIYRRSVADGSIELVSTRTRMDAPLGSSSRPSISFDGNWIAFETTDAGIFATDPEPAGSSQIALVDMTTGTLLQVSSPRGAGAIAPSGENSDAMVSADGAHVVFTSTRPGMNSSGAPTSTAGTVEIFDRASNTITTVSSGVNATSGSPEEANGASGEPVVSADGRFVAFTSSATNLRRKPSPGGGAARSHVYRWDATDGTVELVSSTAEAGSTAANDTSHAPSISADGNLVGYISAATDLLGSAEIPKTTNHMTDAYIRKMSSATTRRVSLTLLDEAHSDVPDSLGKTPSRARSRAWFETGISTTDIKVAADGRSAILTSMSPLLIITGEGCWGCQNFKDSNSAMDVYQVLMTGDLRPLAMQPISVKRDNQDLSREMLEYVRESTTGGGDSRADGITPATADGRMVAYSSQAGDLRGVVRQVQISAAGPPAWHTNAWLPEYADGGVPDEHGEPVRMFTVASNVFNSHLHVPSRVQAELTADPGRMVAYESRGSSQQDLNALPITATATSFVSLGTAPPDAAVTYGLTVTAERTGSAEVIIDLDQYRLVKEASVPRYWVKSKSDAANTLTYTNTLVHSGDTSVFSLQLILAGDDPAAGRGTVTASVNNEAFTSTAATTRIAPAAPTCVSASGGPVIAGLKKILFGVQCTSPLPMTVHADHGAVALDGSGKITYTPESAYRGPDAIIITTADSANRTSEPVRLDVTVAAPFQTVSDSYTVRAGDLLTTDAAAGVLANDKRPSGTAATAWRVQEGFAPAHGELSMNDATGQFTFRPSDGFTGEVTFRYRVNGVGLYDGAVSDIVTVTIHVLP